MEHVTEALKMVEALELKLNQEGAEEFLQDEIACIRVELQLSLGLEPIRGF